MFAGSFLRPSFDFCLLSLHCPHERFLPEFCVCLPWYVLLFFVLYHSFQILQSLSRGIYWSFCGNSATGKPILKSMNITEFTQDPNQVFLLPNNDPTSLRCIDDRYSKEDGPLANYAVPGAGLGLITDVYGGFEAVLKNLTQEQIEAIYVAARKVIGTPTFHTGHGHDDIASPVEGCGYCAATLEGRAHISSSAAAYLKAHATEIASNGYDVVDFKDKKHNASFVLLVEDYDTGVMPTAPDGTCAYVVYTKVQSDLLTKITEAAYDALADELIANNVSETKQDFVAAVLEASKKRFGEVAAMLPAHNGLKATEIPMYVVSHGKEPVLVNGSEEDQVAA
jgi:hypothetical protein